MAVEKSIFDKVSYIQKVDSYNGVFVDGRKLTGEKLTEPSFYAFYVATEEAVELSAEVKKIIRGKDFSSSLSSEELDDDILLENDNYCILLDDSKLPLGILVVRGENLVFSSVIKVGESIFQNDSNNLSELTTTLNPFNHTFPDK